MHTTAITGPAVVDTGGTCDALYCLVTGWEHIPFNLLVEGEEDTTPRWLPFTSVVAHCDDGWFLFDTGLSGDFRDDKLARRFFPADLPRFLSDREPMLDALAACGLTPDDLTAVVMSHLHLDHTGGLRHLAGGPPVIVQRDELEYANSDEANALGYWAPDTGAAGVRWSPIQGDGRIAPGIAAVATPGHAPGHMSFVVDLRESGRWLFAFDAVVVAENVERDRAVVIGTREQDAPARRASHARLLATAQASSARLVPGHCPRTWSALRLAPDSYT